MAYPTFPYTDFHRLNGDYLLQEVNAAKTAAETAEAAAEAAEALAASAGSAALNAVQFVEQELTTAQKAQARTNIGAVGPGDVPTLDTVVQVVPQSFTDNQKRNARDNIGAADQAGVSALTEEAVKITAQTFTGDQQTQARTNIGAAAASGLASLASTVTTLQSAVTNKVDVNDGAAVNLKIVSSIGAGQGYGAVLHGSGPAGTGKLAINQVVSGVEVSNARARLGVGTPVSDDDAATKAYADTKVSKNNAEIVGGVKITNTQPGAGYVQLYSEYDPSTQDTTMSLYSFDSQGSYQGLSQVAVGNPVAGTDAATKSYVDGYQETVSSTTPTITPAANTVYNCGELSSLTITSPPATGSWVIKFTSGSTPTTTTIPATVIFPEPFAAAANTRYEINVEDGYAVVVGWPVS